MASQPSGNASQNGQSARSYMSVRPWVLSLVKVLIVGIAQVPAVRAYPLSLWSPYLSLAEEAPMPPDDPTLWIYLLVAVGLVLLGGAFAGLTIALMGQDEIYLQVIKTSGDSHEQKYADGVLTLLKRGKHWVLVTLLLGNVITNETLPIVLDRSLGGGWPAVLGSTVMIVIFGEIIPQSICVRYGLPIGAWMSPLVLILMYILAPVAWPTAKLLDYLLGEDHGTTYKKAGLKTLVTLHKSLGAAGEQLNQDEVTIISAVLDLKAKPVGNIMTPMADVFIMSANTVLDEATMEVILGAGYSRIPIHAPDNEQNFVGMLLVKILITYDPEDCKRVRDFALATLPETRAETSCLDIVNFFQEGKSHMVLVSEYPGEDHGALGVVTLEDVIEELIGEEIIDESDVYIDVHKAIRRLNPAPKSRVPKGEVVTEQEDTIADAEESLIDVDGDQKDDSHTARKRNSTAEGLPIKVNGNNQEVAVSPGVKHAFRRSSSIANVSDREGGSRSRQMNPEMREHLKHLGPSNLASRPRTTRYNTVKIKPGAGPRVEGSKDGNIETPRTGSMAAQGGAGGGVLGSAGKDAKDGVLAVQAGYGTIAPGSPPTPKNPRKSSFAAQASEETRQARLGADNDGKLVSQLRSRGNSHSTVGSLNGRDSPSPPNKRGTARSGSITENIIEAGGIRKTVLEMTSSSDDLDEGGARVRGGGSAEGRKSALESGEGGRKKRRRRKRKPGEKGGEEEPLLKANAAAAGGGRGGDRS